MPEESKMNTQEEESIRATVGQRFQTEEDKGMESPMSQNTEPILDTFVIQPKSVVVEEVSE